MVSTIQFIKANLQHSIAVSRIISRTVSVKIKDMAQIQEPSYHEGCIKGLNISVYTLYSTVGQGRHRACTFVANITSWMLPRFSCRDLLAVLVKYTEDGVERRLVVCPAYLSCDSEDPPP
jgi:hypothetical protein